MVEPFLRETHALTGHSDTSYRIRQAAYDQRKLRAKDLVDKSGPDPPLPRRSAGRTYHRRSAHRPRQVIAPVLAGIRSPEEGPKSAHWTPVDRDYEQIRIRVQAFFTDLALTTPLVA